MSVDVRNGLLDWWVIWKNLTFFYNRGELLGKNLIFFIIVVGY